MARLTYENHEVPEIMGMLNHRLNDKGKNWRHVMKSLTVLEFLLLNGSESVVLWAKDNIYIIKTLREFQYVDDAGLDQGQNIRARAKHITALLRDDDRLRRERQERKRGNGSRRGRTYNSEFDDLDAPSQDRYSRNSRNSSRQRRPSRLPPSDPDDEELKRALEESRLTAEEEERRRKNQNPEEDEDIRKAIMLSKEEEEQRRMEQEAAFQLPKQNENLIDFSQPSQPQVQYQVTAQPVYITGQNGIYGASTGMYQQPISTGYIQNMYAGMPQAQYTGFQQPQQTGFQMNPQQTGVLQYPQPQLQLQQQQPLAPMKTGSNNPFAKLASQSTSSFSNQPSLEEIQRQQQLEEQQRQQQLLFQQQQEQQRQQQLYQQQQQQQQQQTLKPVSTGRSQHMEELNTLLATGNGLDTFGNTGDVRIPAHHTRTQFINSQGTGYQAQYNGGAQPPTNNPFIGSQYTGMVNNTPIQPAFTGYGFGNAQQSQQAYQNQQQQHTSSNNQSLIDI